MKRILLVRSALTICLALLAGLAVAQERTVSGKVTSAEDGTPIPGVNVVVKGTTNGTTTDVDGNYRLTLPGTGGTLVFSFIGLRGEEISVGDRTVVDIAMSADVTQLSEVVVVGYGTTERRKLSTSVASVQGSAISNLATPSFVDQLAGRAAGVQIGVNNGVIGQTPTINIRGINSITSGTFPLVVIDGVPMITGNQSAATNTNPLADINPNDIESFDILKDGAATAIYGSRAAGGVILITTKRGAKIKGKGKIDFSASTGYSEAVNRFDLANAEEFMTIANAKLAAAGLAASAFMDPNNPTSGETDWQDFLLRKGKFSNYNIGLSGANESTNYYVSLGVQNQESTVRANDFSRYSVRMNADHKMNKFLKIGTGVQFTRSETNGLNTGANALSGNLAGGVRLFPNVTIHDPSHPTGFNLSPDGQSVGIGANTRTITSSWTNQGFVLEHNKFRATTDRLLANAYGQIDIVEGLSFKSLFGVDYLGNKDYIKTDPRHGDGRSLGGNLQNTFRTVTRWNWQNTVNFNKDFGDHGVDIVAGLEYQYTEASSFTSRGTGFADPFFMQNGLITGTFTNQFSSGTNVPTAFQSSFGRLNYSFKDRYLLGVSVRRDGISSLSEDNRFGVFPGASFGYRISEEDFFKNSGVTGILNDLKLRVSYAQVGNTDIGSFPYVTQYGASRYGTQNGIGFTQAGNANLVWETSTKVNVGADFGFRNNRFTLSFDWFKNDIDDNILNVPYAPSLGIPNPDTPNTIAQNLGLVRNSGLEFSASANVLNNSALTWNVSANFTTVKNEVVETFLNSAGVYADVLSPDNGGFQILARVGEPINVIYGYTWAGVNSSNGNPMYEKGDGRIVQRNAQTGVYSFYDSGNPTSEAQTAGAALNPGDVVNGGDRKVLGNTTPTWYGGLTNTLGYKGFSLELFFRYSGGNYVYNRTRQDVLLNQDFTNSGTELLNAWTPENTESDIPRMYIFSNQQVNQSGSAVSRFLEKGDFLRIQNIVLSYSLPKSILDKTGAFGLTNVRVFAQVQNALTFTQYTGLDPELGVLSNGINSGIDNNVNPLSRTFTLGINIGL